MTALSPRRLFARLSRSVKYHFSSLASLGVRGLGVAASFVVTFLIGRWYGPEANGQYAIVTQTAMFLSVVAVGGLDMGVTREFSKSAAVNRPLSHQTIVRVLAQAMLVSVLTIILLAIGGGKALALLGKESVPEGALTVLSIILLSRALTRLTAAVLRSQKSYVFSQAVELLLIPVFTIGLLAAARLHTVMEILWATAIAGVLVAAIGVIAAMRHGSSRDDALKISGRTVFATALPLWGVAIASNFADWYGLATVSAINGIYDAGLYRVAIQIASVLSIVSFGLFGTYSVQISAAVHSGDKDEVARLAGSATRLSAALVLPVALASFVFAPQLLASIGPEFEGATTLLRILVVGQFIYTLTGPCGLVLATMGYGRINLAITIVSTLIMLAAAPISAHAFGSVGVALFVSIVLVGRNVASLIAVRLLERINVLTGRRLVAT